MSRIGVVTIGRNEGQRLINSLKSIIAQLPEKQSIVYVDSGSSDRSTEAAKELGVEVVNLDMTIPFTAARARNAGFERLYQLNPEMEYVQFIDGDCQMVAGWLEAAANTLDTHPEAVAVCGYRRELYPEKSPYNRICDVEWRMGDPGEANSFGGEVMIRVPAFVAVKGYNNQVIAAEDDELSVRLRQSQGKILRIERDSSRHDADMYSLWQWWQRAKRCGYAFALVSSLHGTPPERKFSKEIRGVWLWGLIVPLIILILAIPTHGLSLIALGIYPLKALKVIVSSRKRGLTWSESIPWGISCAFSHFPGVSGAIKFKLDSFYKKSYEIIEYKGAKQPVNSNN